MAPALVVKVAMGLTAAVKGAAAGATLAEANWKVFGGGGGEAIIVLARGVHAIVLARGVHARRGGSVRLAKARRIANMAADEALISRHLGGLGGWGER